MTKELYPGDIKHILDQKTQHLRDKYTSFNGTRITAVPYSRGVEHFVMPLQEIYDKTHDLAAVHCFSDILEIAAEFPNMDLLAEGILRFINISTNPGDITYFGRLLKNIVKHGPSNEIKMRDFITVRQNYGKSPKREIARVLLSLEKMESSI